MECAEILRVQAYFDGELDAAGAAAVERHLDTCAACQRLLQDLKEVRTLVHDNVPVTVIPTALRDRIAKSLDRESQSEASQAGRPVPSAVRSRPFWIGVLTGVGAAAAAAGVVFVVLSSLLNNRLLDELVADHIHSLTPSHLVAVVSTDQHTVKPWFAGRAEVSPVVADFAPAGYPLIGGRVDALDHQRAAVLVYQHGPHFINVFSWAAARTNGLPRDGTRNGYHLAFWQAGNLQYCAISDTGWNELQGLVRLIQEQTAREVPP